MALVGNAGVMIGTGADAADQEVLVLFQLGDLHAVGGEVAGQGDRAVAQFQTEGIAGGHDPLDGASVQEILSLLGLGVHVGAQGAVQAAGAGVNAGAFFLNADDVVQQKGHVLQAVIIEEFVDVGVGQLVAPHIQGAVVHQNGGALIAAGQLLDVGHVNAALHHDLFRHHGDIGVIDHFLRAAVLAQLVIAPGVHLAVFADGYNVVDTSGHHGDLGILDLVGNVGHVDAGSADLGRAPDIDLTGVGQTHGKAAVGVDHLNIVPQLPGHGHHAHGRGHALLGDLGVAVRIVSQEQGADEHEQEHGDDHAQREHGQLPFHEITHQLTAGADDFFHIVDAVFFLLLQRFLGVLAAGAHEGAADPAEGRKALFGGGLLILLFAHLLLSSLLADADARIHQTVHDVDNQIAQQGQHDVEHLQQHDDVKVRRAQG